MNVVTNNTVEDNIISTLKNAKESFVSELESIEAEYKKKLEEAKSSLSAKIEEIDSQLEYWNKASYGIMEKKPRKPRQKKTEVDVVEKSEELNIAEEAATIEANESVEEPETVVDTLFEDNNEPESEAEEVADYKDEKEMEEAFEEKSSEDPFESSTEESAMDLDEGWPETPEEWK